MNGPMAPLRTQTAKEKSKYRKAAKRVGGWPDLRKAFMFAMDWSLSVRNFAMILLEKKIC